MRAPQPSQLAKAAARREKAAKAPILVDLPMPDGNAERRRVTALELAIRAAPYLLPTNLDRITGAQLTAEAEKIEAWLKEAK